MPGHFLVATFFFFAAMGFSFDELLLFFSYSGLRLEFVVLGPIALSVGKLIYPLVSKFLKLWYNCQSVHPVCHHVPLS